MSDITLTNGNLQIVIDPQTGSLVRIEDTRRGIVHLHARSGGRNDGRLFRLMAPLPDRMSRHVDNDAAAPEVRRADGDLTLTWNDLPYPDASSGIGAEVRIEPAPAADEMLFTITVNNNGPVNVMDVFFPAVSGWTGIGGGGRDEMILGGQSNHDPHGFPINKGTTYARLHQRAEHHYPIQMYAPWADLSGPGGGLSYLLYARTAKNAAVCLENLAGYGSGLRLCFGWQIPCVIRPGESWTSPPIGIAAHGGDWHDTADRYREWTEQWWSPVPIPRERREMIGFQNVWLRGFDGTPFNPLDSIPALAEAGRRFGVNDLCLWDYITNGNYAKHEDRDLLDFTEEEKTTIRAGLARAKEEGTNVSALINFRLINPTQSLFEKEAKNQIIKCYDGSARTESYVGRHENMYPRPQHLGPTCFLASPFAPGYRERVLRQTREYLELGFTSMFYDQPFETAPDYGRMDRGCRPEDTMAAVVSLVEEVEALIRENDPEAYLIGEFCDIFAAQHIDLWMAWYTNVQQLVRSRYSLPHPMQSWVVDTDAAQASHATALGAYLCLCTHGNEATLADEPEFAEHVKRLARLRRRTADRTVHARFKDTLGLTVDADEGIAAYSYDSASGPAVTIAATEGAGSGQVKIDRARFLAPGGKEGRLDRLG